jgi:membrane-anchored glycerophosphoryl diester phosphodiesterase (GDPDase)
MNEHLRPSNFGEILDRTVQIYRSRFLVLFGIAAVPTALLLIAASGVFLFFAWFGSDLGVAGSASSTSSPTPGAAVLLGLAAIGIVLVAMPFYFAIIALSMAAMSHATARACFDQKTTIRDAYRAIWARRWRYIGLLFFEALIIAGPPLAAWLVIVMVSAGGMALAQTAGAGVAGTTIVVLFAVLAGLAIVAYCIWMTLRLSLAFPACVVEQTGAWSALKRSASLSKGTRGRIFLLLLLIGVINYVLSMIMMVPILIALALAPGTKDPQNQQTAGMVFLFLNYAVSFAVQAFTQPVFIIALVLFYYDQRIRLEGFDIEWMMQRAGLVVPAPQDGAPALSPIATGETLPEQQIPQPANDLQPSSPPASGEPV